MIEGRPAEHPIHRSYAQVLDADFLFIDHFLPYQGKTNNKSIVFLSWVLTSIYLLFQRKYTLYLCGGPCPPLILLRKYGLLSSNKKIVSLAANETLYFLKEGRYSNFTSHFYKQWYNNTIDAIISIGGLQEKLAKEIIKGKGVKFFKIANGLETSFFELANRFVYNAEAVDIIFIANGPAGFRVYYKGLDLLISSFEAAAKEGILKGKLFIVGDWDESVISMLLGKVSEAYKNQIVFVGKVKSYFEYLNNVSLAVHFSRGDSFPTTNLETMALGIPTMVTNITGTMDIVAKVSPNLITEPEKQSIIKGLKWFYSLSANERQSLSELCKKTLQRYRHEDAVRNFYNCISEVLDGYRKD